MEQQPLKTLEELDTEKKILLERLAIVTENLTITHRRYQKMEEKRLQKIAEQRAEIKNLKQKLANYEPKYRKPDPTCTACQGTGTWYCRGEEGACTCWRK